VEGPRWTIQQNQEVRDKPPLRYSLGVRARTIPDLLGRFNQRLDARRRVPVIRWRAQITELRDALRKTVVMPRLVRPFGSNGLPIV
jgi:hypothetical protein